MENKMEKKIINITWLDAAQMHERIREEDFDSYVGLSKNQNIGWILNENEDRVILCFGTCSTGEFDIMAIPTNAIVERETLSCKWS